MIIIVMIMVTIMLMNIDGILILKAHVHPNGFARLCFCFETIILSNAVF